jgi:hypothetical protein
MRREVERLDVKMKEDLGTMKHEFVFPLDASELHSMKYSGFRWSSTVERTRQRMSLSVRTSQ